MFKHKIIKQIEKELGVTLKKVKEIVVYKSGYTINQQEEVVGLSLYRCAIKDLNRIESQLKALANLTALDLANNQLTEIESLKDLTNLTRLDLANNQLTEIESLKDLTNLTRLDLANNQLTEIESLNDLTNLTRLDLSNNPIEALPQWIIELNMEFKWKENGWQEGFIYFYDNPLKHPPIEIVKQGKDAVKNYFEQIRKQGTDEIYEAKLMIVGEPGSGKTTLMNKLFDMDFPVPNKETKSTVGIEVRPNWEFTIDEKKDFKAHVWDFGGQQIQYMLHQFFLTPDCIYILMAEKRKELANFDYWLNIINLLGKNSPVVVLFNEIEIESATSFIYDEQKYAGLFPDLSIQKLDVNLSNIRDGRFAVLLNTIKEKLKSLNHVGKEVPARWVDIRGELEKNRSKKHITVKEYFEICAGYGIDKEEDQLLILSYFHLLGTVLHFSEDENLSDTIFLDPNWPVNAVYSALANIEIQENNGRFEKSEIYKIWEAKGHDYEERGKLLQLMLKDNFDLCFKLPKSEGQYIVPMLLAKKKPVYDWNNSDNLQFRFQYPFRPKGIVSRMIVRMHECIDGEKVWNEGAVFVKEDVSAQILEKKTEKEGLKIIEIRLNGPQNGCKDFLALIREEIKSIQNRSFPNLPFVEMVPCNCKECFQSQKPYFFEYIDIENYLKKKKVQIECRNSAESVYIDKLIGNVFNIEEIEEKYKKIMGDKINIHLSNIGNPQQTVKTDANLKANQSQTVTVSVEIKQETIDAHSLFKKLKADILKAVDIEITDEKEKKWVESDLLDAEGAFSEVEKAAEAGKKADAGTIDRFENFIDELKDENSRINKALKLVKTGAKTAQKIGRLYNNFSGFFGLPAMPGILLNKKNGD